MTDLKVLALRADEYGCGFYRVEEPVRVARCAGVDVTISNYLPVEAYSNSLTDETTVKRVKTDANVIIFQRPLLKSFGAAIVQAQRQGIACIVDIDDDLSSVHPENMAYKLLHPKYSTASNYRHLEYATSIADLVTVSTPALARRYGSHGRAVVLRNRLPESIFDVTKIVADPPRLGWTGIVHTHPRDLDVVGTHVGTVLRNTGVDFTVIGDGVRIREKLFIGESTRVNVSGWLPLESYYQAIADGFEVGIVPLEQSVFNDGKSFLKGMEFAALGVPFVASPTPEYRYLSSEYGVGLVTSKGAHWQRYIKRLLTSRDLLLEESARHRAAVRALTYENYAGDWITAWARAVENRASALRAT